MSEPGNPGRQTRTGSREDRDKFNLVLAIVCQAIAAADSEITRAEQYARSPRAEFRKTVAHILSVFWRNGLFVIPVGSGESLRDRILLENEIEEIEVWFVGIGGCVAVWVERWGAADTIEGEEIEMTSG